MEDKKLYITYSFGSYYSRIIIGVFDCYDKAFEAAKEEIDLHHIDESKLPMTFDEYYNCNYGYPDIDDDFNSTDKDWDYYNTLIDRDGHTVSDFEIMRKADINQHDDFSHCVIEEAILNGEVNHENSISIWYDEDEKDYIIH